MIELGILIALVMLIIAIGGVETALRQLLIEAQSANAHARFTYSDDYLTSRLEKHKKVRQ